jgi:type I restriction enzyme, S subunit
VRYRGFFGQTQNLARQNELLICSRDALLPRLLSGKISVKNLDIHFPPSMADELKTEPIVHA